MRWLARLLGLLPGPDIEQYSCICRCSIPSGAGQLPGHTQLLSVAAQTHIHTCRAATIFSGAGGKVTPEVEALIKEKNLQGNMGRALLNHQKVKKWTKVGAATLGLFSSKERVSHVGLPPKAGRVDAGTA